MVSEEGHHDAHRDSAASVPFRVDEVFQTGENIAQFTWPSRSPAGLHGALLLLVLDARHQAIRNAEDSGDVSLVDPVRVLRAQHAEDLEGAWSGPKVSTTNLPDQVGHPLPSFRSDGVDSPQNLSQGHGRESLLGSFFDRG